MASTAKKTKETSVPRTEETINNWQPPETAPKDRAFMITTAGPNQDLCFWDPDSGCFRDYHYKQRIPPEWPYMVAWRDMSDPAAVCNTIEESRKVNGWE